MSKIMKIATPVPVIATLIFAVLYDRLHMDIFLTLAITFGTISYHTLMRLLVGAIYNVCMRNHADYTKKWYCLHSWEERLYTFLRVKKWKDKMPTYAPDGFNPKLHTWDEIAQAMCQAELVHETIIILSFLPILAAVWVGALPVFIITSIAAALCLDVPFVIIQRYNRHRVVKLLRFR